MHRSSPHGSSSSQSHTQLQIPSDLEKVVAWQKRKYDSYKEGDRLPEFTEEEPYYSNSYEHREWAKAKDAHDRNMTAEEQEWLKGQLETHGLHVTFHIDPLPTDQNAYGKASKYWDEAEYAEKDAPLLQIRITKGSHFVEYSGREYSDDEITFDYHISLCFTNELHRFDLLDSNRGVELGKAAYNKLRETYNGKEVMLNGHIQKTAFYIDPGSKIQDSLPDFITNADFIMLHNAGAYADRPHHLSM